MPLPIIKPCATKSAFPHLVAGGNEFNKLSCVAVYWGEIKSSILGEGCCMVSLEAYEHLYKPKFSYNFVNEMSDTAFCLVIIDNIHPRLSHGLNCMLTQCKCSHREQ